MLNLCSSVEVLRRQQFCRLEDLHRRGKHGSGLVLHQRHRGLWEEPHGQRHGGVPEGTWNTRKSSSLPVSPPVQAFRDGVAGLVFQGCHDAVVELLKENIQWVIVAALVIAFLQVRLHPHPSPHLRPVPLSRSS